MTEPVRSTRNPRVVAASRLHRARERKATGHTLVEGPHVAAEAIAAGVGVVEFFVAVGDHVGADLAAEAGIEPVLVEPAVLARVAGTESPRGPVMVIEIPSPGRGDRDAVVLDVTDPGNAGTLIRTAAAFGLDVVSVQGSTDLWAPKVVRAAAGAHFRTTIAGEAPSASIATVVEGGVPPWELQGALDPDRRWSVLVGSEAHGLHPDLAAAADVRVTIPMPGGTESLNAAMAAGIVMYELSRWRSG